MVRFLRQKGFVSHFKYIKQYNLGLYFARRYCTSHGIFSRNVTEALDRIMTEERVKLAPYNVECVFGHNSKRAITNALLYTVDRDFNYTNPVLIPEDQHHLYHSFATYFSDIYEEGFEHMRRFIVDGEQPPANLLPPIAALQTFFAEKGKYIICHLVILRFRYNFNLQLPMQSVPITTKALSSRPVYGDVYSIQCYVKKFVSDFRQVGGFLRELWFPPPIKLTAMI